MKLSPTSHLSCKASLRERATAASVCRCCGSTHMTRLGTCTRACRVLLLLPERSHHSPQSSSGARLFRRPTGDGGSGTEAPLCGRVWRCGARLRAPSWEAGGGGRYALGPRFAAIAARRLHTGNLVGPRKTRPVLCLLLRRRTACTAAELVLRCRKGLKTGHVSHGPTRLQACGRQFTFAFFRGCWRVAQGCRLCAALRQVARIRILAGATF